MKWFTRKQEKSNNKRNNTRNNNNNNKKSHSKAKHFHVGNLMNSIDQDENLRKLKRAVLDNNLDLLKEVLNKDPTLLTKDIDSGSTILHLAAHKGRIDAVKYILEFDKIHKKIDINLKNNQDISALYYAISSEEGPFIEVVKELLKNEDINTNMIENNKDTSLSYASKVNEIEIVKELLKNPNTDINLKNAIGMTPLTIAIILCNKKIVKLLLDDKRIDINCYKDDDNGNIPYLLEALFFYPDIIDDLLKHPNINVDITVGKEEYTPLMRVIGNMRLYYSKDEYEEIKGDPLEIVKKLLNAGADINKRDKIGRTVLLYACQSSTPSMVKYLLDAGADTDVKDINGYNAVNYVLSRKDSPNKNIKDNFKRDEKEILLLLSANTNNLKVNTTILNIINFDETKSNSSIDTLNIKDLTNSELYKEGNAISATELDEFMPNDYVAVLPIINGEKKFRHVYYIENLSSYWATKPLFNPRINRTMTQEEIDETKIYKLVDSKKGGRRRVIY